jgi:pimeloyl-ACP methyl ester carboxylesterase
MLAYAPGFVQHTVLTELGTMVYYTNQGSDLLNPGQTIDNIQTLVFIHGLGGGSSSYEWSKVYPAFASEYRVIAPDLIGWGQSDHPARQYTVDDYVSTLSEFLSKICPTPVTVIASSLSAAFMVRVAISHPELIESLILIAPAGLRDFGKETPTFLTELLNIPILDKVLYWGAVANEGAIRNFLEQRTFAKPERVYPEIVNAYLKSAQQPNAEYSALSFVRGDLSFDLASYITQLTTPTAIVWGQEAKFTSPDIGRRLAEMNPHAIRVFQQLDDVGLTPQLELPAVMVGLIQKYLRTLHTTDEFL